MQLIKFDGLTEAENKRIANLMAYTVNYNKLWSEAERSLTGAFKGTLIGIFPKLTITVSDQKDSDRSLLLKTVNSQFKKVTYYDTEYQSMVEKTFYFGDAADQVRRAVGNNKNNVEHSAIEISIIATTRRTINDKV